MKIKIDENLPESLAGRLSLLGHDVDTVRAEGLAGEDDRFVWGRAQEEGRFFITQDLDFSDFRLFAPGTHHGLLLVRLPDAGRIGLVESVAGIFTMVVWAILSGPVAAGREETPPLGELVERTVRTSSARQPEFIWRCLFGQWRLGKMGVEEGSIGNRLLIWQDVPAMIAAAPQGWGFGNAARAWMNWFQPMERGETYLNLVSTHSTWVVEGGWVFGAVYLAGWVAVPTLLMMSRRRGWLAGAVWVTFGV